MAGTPIAVAQSGLHVIFPGAGARGIVCTPGPPLKETAEIHRRVWAFLNDGQAGRADPKTTTSFMRTSGVRNFLKQFGPIRRLEFRGANAACTKDMASYEYYVVGARRSERLSIEIFRGKIGGYAEY